MYSVLSVSYRASLVYHCRHVVITMNSLLFITVFLSHICCFCHTFVACETHMHTYGTHFFTYSLVVTYCIGALCG